MSSRRKQENPQHRKYTESSDDPFFSDEAFNTTPEISPSSLHFDHSSAMSLNLQNGDCRNPAMDEALNEMVQTDSPKPIKGGLKELLLTAPSNPKGSKMANMDFPFMYPPFHPPYPSPLDSTTLIDGTNKNSAKFDKITKPPPDTSVKPLLRELIKPADSIICGICQARFSLTNASKFLLHRKSENVGNIRQEMIQNPPMPIPSPSFDHLSDGKNEEKRNDKLLSRSISEPLLLSFEKKKISVIRCQYFIPTQNLASNFTACSCSSLMEKEEDALLYATHLNQSRGEEDISNRRFHFNPVSSSKNAAKYPYKNEKCCSFDDFSLNFTPKSFVASKFVLDKSKLSEYTPSRSIFKPLVKILHPAHKEKERFDNVIMGELIKNRFKPTKFRCNQCNYMTTKATHSIMHAKIVHNLLICDLDFESWYKREESNILAHHRNRSSRDSDEQEGSGPSIFNENYLDAWLNLSLGIPTTDFACRISEDMSKASLLNLNTKKMDYLERIFKVAPVATDVADQNENKAEKSSRPLKLKKHLQTSNTKNSNNKYCATNFSEMCKSYLLERKASFQDSQINDSSDSIKRLDGNVRKFHEHQKSTFDDDENNALDNFPPVSTINKCTNINPFQAEEEEEGGYKRFEDHRQILNNSKGNRNCATLSNILKNSLLFNDYQDDHHTSFDNKIKNCEFCGKTFRFMSNLIVHRRSHTGEKPYKCPICPHACTQASKLKRHMKTHENVAKLLSSSSFYEDSLDASGDSSSNEMPEEFLTLPSNEKEAHYVTSYKRKGASSPLQNNHNVYGEYNEHKNDDRIPTESRLEIFLKKGGGSGEGVIMMNGTPHENGNGRELLKNKRLNEMLDEKPCLSGEAAAAPYVMDEYRRESLISYFKKARLGIPPYPPTTNNSNSTFNLHKSSSNVMDDSLTHLKSTNNSNGGELTNCSELNYEGLKSCLSTITTNNEEDTNEEGLEDEIIGRKEEDDFIMNKIHEDQNATLVDDNDPQSVLSNGNSTASSNKKSATCEYCGKVFRNCSNLTVHRRSHTGEKPYKCGLCHYACAQSSKLTRHMRTHGRLTDKVVYRCRFCEMPFSLPTTLQKHMRKCLLSHHTTNGGGGIGDTGSGGEQESVKSFPGLNHVVGTANSLAGIDIESLKMTPDDYYKKYFANMPGARSYRDNPIEQGETKNGSDTIDPSTQIKAEPLLENGAIENCLNPGNHSKEPCDIGTVFSKNHYSYNLCKGPNHRTRHFNPSRANIYTKLDLHHHKKVPLSLDSVRDNKNMKVKMLAAHFKGQNHNGASTLSSSTTIKSETLNGSSLDNSMEVNNEWRGQSEHQPQLKIKMNDSSKGHITNEQDITAQYTAYLKTLTNGLISSPNSRYPWTFSGTLSSSQYKNNDDNSAPYDSTNFESTKSINNLQNFYASAFYANYMKMAAAAAYYNQQSKDGGAPLLNNGHSLGNSDASKDLQENQTLEFNSQHHIASNGWDFNSRNENVVTASREVEESDESSIFRKFMKFAYHNQNETESRGRCEKDFSIPTGFSPKFGHQIYHQHHQRSIIKDNGTT